MRNHDGGVDVAKPQTPHTTRHNLVLSYVRSPVRIRCMSACVCVAAAFSRYVCTFRAFFACRPQKPNPLHTSPTCIQAPSRFLEHSSPSLRGPGSTPNVPKSHGGEGRIPCKACSDGFRVSSLGFAYPELQVAGQSRARMKHKL